MQAVSLPTGGRCAGRQLARRAARPQAPRIARAALRPRAIAEAEKPAPAAAAGSFAPLAIDISQEDNSTCIVVQGTSRPGLLSSLTSTFTDLGLDVVRAEIGGKGGNFHDTFWVTTADGRKVNDADVASVKNAIEVSLAAFAKPATAVRPKLTVQGISEDRQELLHTLMDTYVKNDVLSIQQSIVNHVEYTLARSRYMFDDLEAYMATAYSVRDRLIEEWNDTQTFIKEVDPKRVYYLSMEFLMGRSLLNALNNLDVLDQYKEALTELGYKLETLVEKERDAALGNGGLGRLAACFLDSLATLNLPAWGYGIRYQYGMFRQVLVDGFQHEQPDYWLNFGNPWELERLNVGYPISFYGHVSVHDEGGRQVFRWNPGETVTAVAYDNPIPGFGTNNTINLRLWAAKPDREFDLQAFNTGDYVQAILSKQRAETLSSVLYPDDRTYEGKELRLKQQHFFVSATVQDVVRRFREKHSDWEEFPDKVAFQLNDTHPTLLVPELMRILMDQERLGWTKAWELVQKTCNFTNHTVLPEALEKWPVAMMEKLLPRHMQIIYDINWRFLQQMRQRFGDDWARIAKLSIIEETASGEKTVRMAYLAVIASAHVNGVAKIHSDILKHDVFGPFYDIFPEKFQNKTNGVTLRRWLAYCNPELSALITEALGTDAWVKDATLLAGLKPFAEDAAFRKRWRDVKFAKKAALAKHIKEVTGYEVSTQPMFDVQVKRIHEYKRQFMNAISIIYRYKKIKEMSPEERKKVVPRVCIFGGKAASAYYMAKKIVALLVAVAAKVNNDPEVGDLLKVVFLPNYNVSEAEVIIPAAELSQHISTAGTEASGTSNMKFALNGSFIIGTMDGANIEIGENTGFENLFIFGVKAEEINRLREERKDFKDYDPRWTEALEWVKAGAFGRADYFDDLVASVNDMTRGNDWFLLANDFASYMDAQDEVDKLYKDQEEWTRRSILYTAGNGFFSSDRTIDQYAKEIWNVQACRQA